MSEGVRWTRTLREGEIGGVVLESMGGTPRRVTPEEAQQLQDDTARFWRSWLHRSTYTGRWREMVNRSAITLKLMTYAPTGAPVAAPTTGLPEQAGGERNWDYRYTWIRDGSFSIYALLGLGYVEEAAAFGAWLRDRAEEQAGNASGPLKICTGSTAPRTWSRNPWITSRLARVPAGADRQRRRRPAAAGHLGRGDGLDLPGRQLRHHRRPPGLDGSRTHHRLAVRSLGPADEGIWETRGGQRNFTYGRFQTWVALDRAIRLAARRGRPANIARWTDVRDQIYTQIMDRGWNPKVGAFTQHYDTEVLDSSLLLMPLQGFIAPRDPMWLSTLDAMDRELVSDSLVYRYNPAASPDGLRGDEGTFSLCTFWYVDALARAGRMEEARLVFEKMFTYANHLGLFSEEIDATGGQLGNFPQAFSHLSLISAAINLNRQLDHGPGTVEPIAQPAGRAEELGVVADGLESRTDGRQRGRVGAGHRPGHVPGAQHHLTSKTGYGLSSSQYGVMFLPQVALAIATSLLGAELARRITTKRVYLLGLACSTVSMVLLLASTLAKANQAAAYPLLLVATAFLGAGFGLTVPVLNTYTSVFHPGRVDRSVLVLNALLGLGTALAPVLVAAFVGLGFWWGLPIVSAVLLVALLLVSLRLPLRAGARAAGGRARTGIPARFWLYAAFAVCYGICETMNGNWSQLDMTTRLGASATQASLALAVFWAMVTIGRVLFGAIDRWLPERVTHHILPFVLVGTFLLTGVLTRPHAAAGIGVFALAGLGCSALLPLTISFGQQDLTTMAAAAAGGVIAFYQLGYGIAAFSVGPAQHAGVSLSAIFGFAAVIAGVMALLSFFVARRRPAPAELVAAGAGSSRPTDISRPLRSESRDGP